MVMVVWFLFLLHRCDGMGAEFAGLRVQFGLVLLATLFARLILSWRGELFGHLLYT